MHVFDYFIIVFYLIATFIIGLYFGKNVKSLKDYAVGDKGFTVPLLVTTIFATMSGGNTIIGTSEKLFTVGFIFVLARLGDPIYKLLIAKYIVPRMGQFQNALSVGDILKVKFGRFGQVIGGLASFVKSIGSVSAQVAAISIFTSSLIDLPLFFSVLISSTIVVVYSSYGGIRSVVMTDVIQFFVLIIGIPILSAISIQNAGGGQKVFESLLSHQIESSKHLLWYLSLFVLSTIPIFNPALVQRLLITKNINFLSRSFKISAFSEIPLLFMIVLMVGAIITLNPNVAPNQIIPYLIETILPIGVRGLVIAGMIAVIMSTADSFINTASVAFTNDIVKPLSKKSLSSAQELVIARIVSVLVGVFATAAALYFKSIFNLYMAFLNIWVPVIVVPLYAVIFNCNCNRTHFIRGAVAGLFAWLLWQFFIMKFIPIHPLLVSLGANILFFHLETVKNIIRKMFSSNYFNKLLQILFLKKIKREAFFPLKYWFILCEKNYGMQSYSFGVFGCFFFLAPFFLITLEKISTPIIFMQVIGATLCAVLIIRDLLPPIVQKKFPVVWMLVLMYTLAFFPTILMIYNPISQVMIITLSAYFLLNFLMNWSGFLILFSIGTLSAFLTAYLFPNIVSSQALGSFLSLNGPLFLIFASVLSISLVFSRKKQKNEEERFRISESIAAEVAHELRTPLQTVNMRIQTTKPLLEKILFFYTKNSSKKEMFSDMKISKLKKTPEFIQSNISRTLKLINMLLLNLKNPSLEKPITLNMATLVENSLKNYPFLSDKDKKIVSLDLESLKDLNVKGHADLLQNLLDNLIKNALVAISKKNKTGAYIKIWGEKSFKKVFLYVQDSGVGIDPRTLLKIFDPFYTSSQYGTGIGLSFCKNTMRSHGGEIYCFSKKGEYTKFTLEFPNSEI